MPDKNISKSKLLAIRAYEKDLVEAIEEIARWTRVRNEALHQIRQLSGGSPPARTTRPWQLVKKRIEELARPITWREALEAAIILEQVSGKLEPLEDLKRSIALARKLKCVNDLIGLSGWPDKVFKAPASE